MRLFVDHSTIYSYDEPLDYALQQLRLTPKHRPGQQVERWVVQVDGGDLQLGYDDHHANHVEVVAIRPGRDHVTIRCQGEVVVEDRGGVVGEHGGMMPLWSFRRATPLTKAGRRVRALVHQLGMDHDGDILRAHALSALIRAACPWRLGVTGPGTTAEQALAAEGGVCQDHAHIFIAAMRTLGHPARYVSGYLMMNDRVEQDATHAWAEAWFDHIGWVGFDISNGHSPDDRYIRVATGFDYQDAAPVRGMRYGSASEKLVVQLQVQQ